MSNKSPSLLDQAAAFMNCPYLSDLRYLSPYQRCVLAAYLEQVEAERHTLFEWNDALEYLSGCDAEDTASVSKEKLLQALRRI